MHLFDILPAVSSRKVGKFSFWRAATLTIPTRHVQPLGLVIAKQYRVHIPALVEDILVHTYTEHIGLLAIEAT